VPVRAFQTLWQAVRDLYEELLLFAGVSALWWLSALLIVPGPPVAAGLYYLAARVVGEQRVDFGFFWEKTKQSFRKSWPVAGINLLTLVLILVNITFYSGLSNLLRYATIIWTYLLLMWLAMQIYLFPMLYRMDEPRLGPMLRNALMLALARPGYTFLLLILLGLATVLSVMLPLLLIFVWPALFALVGTRAAVTVITDVAERQQKPPAQES
jgi:uncharacterized membrane protein YesL